MLPAMWMIEACMNIAVNTVTQVRPLGSASAYGMAPYLDQLVGVGPADQRAAVADRQQVDDDVGQDQPDVTSGNRSVGMLSLIGIMRPGA